MGFKATIFAAPPSISTNRYNFCGHDASRNRDNSITEDHHQGCKCLANRGLRRNVSVSNSGQCYDGPINAFRNRRESILLTFDQVHQGPQERDQNHNGKNEQGYLSGAVSQCEHKKVSLFQVLDELEHTEDAQDPEQSDNEEELRTREKDSQIGRDSGEQIDNPKEAQGITRRPHGSHKPEDILDREQDRKDPFKCDQKVTVARPNRGNAFQHHTDDAEYNYDDENNVECLARRRIESEDDRVDLAAPTRPLAVAGLRFWVQHEVRGIVRLGRNLNIFSDRRYTARFEISILTGTQQRYKKAAMDNATLTLNGKSYSLPVTQGSEGEVGISIRKLRSESKAVTLDPGYANTGACESAITFIDGENGILRYRGYSIEDLAEHSSFVEVCYLLVYGALPTEAQLERFQHKLTYHSMLHEDMKKFFEGYPASAHPMSVLSAMVSSLAAYYPSHGPEELDLNIIRLIAKLKTIAAFSYKKSIGHPYIYPKNNMNYAADFMRMMFAVPAEKYNVPERLVKTLDKLLILHADHEQNCSTSTVRMVGSSGADLFASVSAGISALSGPLHGKANQEVIGMLEKILADGGDYAKYIEKAKDKNDPFRLMGFGHRVYKNFDPRARVIKKTADEVLSDLGIQDPLLDIAKELENAALHDEYFVARKLYPNVDFYSGILYRAMGIPTNMFTVMFSMGRMPGWISQWMEMRDDPAGRIHRPRQIYTGPTQRSYVPIQERG